MSVSRLLNLPEAPLPHTHTHTLSTLNTDDSDKDILFCELPQLSLFLLAKLSVPASTLMVSYLYCYPAPSSQTAPTLLLVFSTILGISYTFRLHSFYLYIPNMSYDS